MIETNTEKLELPPIHSDLTCVLKERGFDIQQYKPRFIERRLSVRMQKRKIIRYHDYFSLLRGDPSEVDALLNSFNVNHSMFFRDTAAFEALEHKVLVPLIKKRQSIGQRELKIWSAGCATGEEPYSVTMLLANLLGRCAGRWKLVIDACDLDSSSIDQARRGVYRNSRFIQKGKESSCFLSHNSMLAKYADYHGGQFAILPEIRRMVNFHCDDLNKKPVLRNYQIILCRNVLIYYSSIRQREIVHHLLRYLEPGGFLMLGMVEMLPRPLLNRVNIVDGTRRIFQKKSGEKND